ncbi:MAG: ZIP family metal transporter [Bacilli bacterium]
MEVFIGLLLTFAVGLFILIGSAIIIFTKNSQKIVAFSMSFAFTVMLGLIFLELIPESLEHINDSLTVSIILTFIFSLLGILFLKVLDHFIPHHEHIKNDENLYHIGIVSSIALILHNFIEGMAIFGTTLSNISLGILVSIGVGIHNIPMGMIITSALYKKEKNNKKTIVILLLLAISALVGGVVMTLLSVYINDFILGICLAITLGMLIYISIFELLPKMEFKTKTNTLGIVLGIIVLLISLLFHHH